MEDGGDRERKQDAEREVKVRGREARRGRRGRRDGIRQEKKKHTEGQEKPIAH